MNSTYLIDKFKLDIPGAIIYGIFDTLTNKIYIGSTFNCKSRFISHFSKLIKNTHYNKHLQRTWNNRNFNDFKVGILQILDTQDKGELLRCEKKWIDLYNSSHKNYGFNMVSDPTTYSFKHTEESKNKMSVYKKTSTIGDKNPFYGKHHSEESKSKIIDAYVKLKYVNVNRYIIWYNYNVYYVLNAKKFISDILKLNTPQHLKSFEQTGIIKILSNIPKFNCSLFKYNTIPYRVLYTTEDNPIIKKEDINHMIKNDIITCKRYIISVDNTNYYVVNAEKFISDILGPFSHNFRGLSYYQNKFNFNILWTSTQFKCSRFKYKYSPYTKIL